MEHERKYEEALKKAKEIIMYYKERNRDEASIEDLETIFPELKESGDEKVIKWLTNLLSTMQYHHCDEDMEMGNKALAWLEKQKALSAKEDIQGREDVLWCIKQAQKYAKDENEMGTCWYAQKWLEKQGEKLQGKSALEGINEVKVDNSNSLNIADEYSGLTDFEGTLADVCIGWIGKELGWKQYIKDNADVLLKIAIKKFNSVQDASFEQKSAKWSEEDEKIYYSLLADIRSRQDGSTNTLEAYYNEQIDWLKSIKQRIEWKPSDRQMAALRIAAEVGTANDSWAMEILKGMYNELKSM